MAEFKKLDRYEVDRITHGGLARTVPIVRLFDMLRGRSGYVRCPHCKERIHPEATVCSACGRDVPSLEGRL